MRYIHETRDEVRAEKGGEANRKRNYPCRGTLAVLGNKLCGAHVEVTEVERPREAEEQGAEDCRRLSHEAAHNDEAQSDDDEEREVDRIPHLCEQGTKCKRAQTGRHSHA